MGSLSEGSESIGTRLPKVSLEKALSETNEWLDSKKIFDSTRDSYKDSIELIAEAISKGYLTLNEKGEFTHTLAFPLGDDDSVKVFAYKARLNDRMLQQPMQGVKGGDADGRMMAYCSALTGQPKAILSSLDSLDKKIMQAIVIFFI